MLKTIFIFRTWTPNTYILVSNNRLPPIHSRQFFFQPLEQLESLPTPSILSWHTNRTHITHLNSFSFFFSIYNRLIFWGILQQSAFDEHHAELLHFCQNTETSGRRPHKIINDPSVHWLQVNVSCCSAESSAAAAVAAVRV